MLVEPEPLPIAESADASNLRLLARGNEVEVVIALSNGLLGRPIGGQQYRLWIGVVDDVSREAVVFAGYNQ